MFFRAKKLTPIDTSSLAKLGQGVVNLSKYTEDEFGQVAKAFQQTDPDPILYSAPPKPRRGTIAYADGTHWNPGQGEGPYYYNGTAWVPLFQYSFPVAPPTQTVQLLETITFAGAASYASSVAWTGYSHIKMIISNVQLSAAGNSIYAELHSAGAYQNTSYVSAASIISLSAASPVFSAPLATTIGIYLYGATDLTVASIPEGASFETIIWNVNDTTKHKHMSTTCAVRSTTSHYWGAATGQWDGGVTAIDGIRFKSSAGTANLNSGVTEIYGIK